MTWMSVGHCAASWGGGGECGEEPRVVHNDDVVRMAARDDRQLGEDRALIVGAGGGVARPVPVKEPEGGRP